MACKEDTQSFVRNCIVVGILASCFSLGVIVLAALGIT